MTKTLTAIVVSHTHWDRAWYLPFETFRQRLMGLLDRLLTLLSGPSSFHSFTFDGQMLPIADYLELCPERREELADLVQAGKLIIGPWYCLADEYLVSPEALIRNLSLGMEMAEDLGGAAQIGYIPDSFGHINQLPQLLQGFGIDNAIFWRGVGDEGEALGNEFLWQGPDGSEVLAIHLRTGYFNASNLGYPNRWGMLKREEYQPSLPPGQLIEAASALARSSNTGVLLLMNGIDHSGVDPSVPKFIQVANQLSSEIAFEHGSLERYLDYVKALAPQNLKVFRGELNRSRYAFGLQGVYSSRIDLTQANTRAQLLLEQYAEPLAVWSWLRGGVYPDRALNQAWRYLLQNQPHDDICGCSTDQVHHENQVRFEQVSQIANPLISDSISAIANQITVERDRGTAFLLYNPLPQERTGSIELQLDFLEDEPPPTTFILEDSEGRFIPYQLLSQRIAPLLEVGSAFTARKTGICVEVSRLPACGYQVIYARPGSPDPVKKTDLKTYSQGMENQFVKVTIRSDGRVDLEDKRNGLRYPGLLEYVDVADRGDEYDFDALPGDAGVSAHGMPTLIRRIAAGPLQASFQILCQLDLPEGLETDRKKRTTSRAPCPLLTQITLRAGSPRLEVITTFQNNVKDHRLRVHFPTPLAPMVVHSDGHFWVNTREVAHQAGEDWDQPPAVTRHQRSFVDLSAQGKGIGILNRGLPEYEILPNPDGHTIALTLLRAVGYLSRGDMASRPGGEAGPGGIETPGAQCQGERIFEFAIAPHEGEWQSIYQDALSYQLGVISRNLDYQPVLPGELPLQPGLAGHTNSQPQEESFLSLEPGVLGLSTVKLARDKSGIVVRIFNPTESTQEAVLQLGFPVHRASLCNLAEQPFQEETVSKTGKLSLPLNPGKVATLLFEPVQRIQQEYTQE